MTMSFGWRGESFRVAFVSVVLDRFALLAVQAVHFGEEGGLALCRGKSAHLLREEK